MENLNNLPPFYIGQKVVCNRGALWFLNDEIVVGPKKDEHVIIKNLYNHPIDGWIIDLVEYPSSNIEEYFIVVEDGEFNFKPLQEQKFPLISYSKVLEEVEVGSN